MTFPRRATRRSASACILLAAGCCLLVLALTSAATSHLTARNASSYGVGGPANPDPCRRNSQNDGPFDSCAFAVRLGVSGNYLGSAGADVQKQPMNTGLPRVEVCAGGLTVPQVRVNDDPCPDGRHVFLLPAPAQLFPGGGVSVGQMYCDREVLGDGSDDDLQQAFDELVVDNTVNDSPDAILPDGTWDDGGIGGACHIPAINQHYLSGYKTSGCQGSGAASDWTAGGQVWIGVGCAATVRTQAPSPVTTCLVNAAIGSDKVAQAGRCIESFFQGQNSPPALVCGAGAGVWSVVNYGEGGGRLAPGVPFPVIGTTPCPFLDSSGEIFVFARIDADSRRVDQDLAGWIDNGW